MKAAIFDVDGTLLDTMGFWQSAPQCYLETLGIKADASLAKKLLSCSIEGAAQLMKVEYEIDLSAEEITEGIINVARDFYATKAQLKKGALEYIKGLYENKIPMIIASSGNRELIESAFSRLGILKYFEGIFTGDKNGTALFEQCMDFLKTPLNETYVFEDSIHAIETARKMGLVTVAVKEIHQDFDVIKNVSHYYMIDYKTEFNVLKGE